MVSFYELFCTATGKSYIGSTAGKLNKRMREHRCLLRAGKHSEPELQADWNRYGEAAFEMRPAPGRWPSAIRSSEIEVRRRHELMLMDLLAKAGKLYNTKRFAFQPPPGASAKAAKARQANGYKPSVESNEKRRLAQLGKPKKRKRDEIVSSS